MLARLGWPVRVYVDKPEGFKAPVEVYVAYCRRHGVFYLDYPRGWYDALWCPLCLKEAEESSKGHG